MRPEPVLHTVREAIESRVTPGGVILVGRSDRTILEAALGHLTYDDKAPPATLSTIYDVASLTKVVVTTTIAMLLYDRRLLDLESPVSSHIPEFSGAHKDTVLVKDLLAHCGGLLWWTALYKQFEGRSPADARRGYIEAICKLPLDYPPRTKTVYSDLGFLLLGELLERIAGAALDDLATREIFEPLGMYETFYRPASTLRSRIAPTESDQWRGRLVHGEVHDENAYGLAGVAPHAGLFSTARSLAPFAQMFLNLGMHDERRLLSEESIRLFTARANLVPGSTRALGWDTPGEGSSPDERFSSSAFGHTGFTGTSLWIDPALDCFAILLTNRVHPTRERSGISELRAAFHSAVARAVSA